MGDFHVGVRDTMDVHWGGVFVFLIFHLGDVERGNAGNGAVLRYSDGNYPS